MKKTIQKEMGAVFGGEDKFEILQKRILEKNPSQVFILVDDNTITDCLPYFKTKVKFQKEPIILSFPAGEHSKNITTCSRIWHELSAHGADRSSLIINLGGGVVTDLGGFVACTYQRGINFINIPTSLLAMVDAAVGGKNGVDLGNLKNQIGIIHNPDCVIVDSYFLNTLPSEHIRSGMAEMMKHGLIHSPAYLNAVYNIELTNPENLSDLVWESIEIKHSVISQDPKELGLRKTLNYGHTLGHAIESFSLINNKRADLLHGEAIAIGMILANFISHKMFNFPKDILEESTIFILKHFKKVAFSKQEIDEIIKLLLFDKKNRNGQVQFVLLSNIGTPNLNCIVPNELIYSSFEYYKNF